MNPLRLLRLIGARKRRDIEFYPPWWLIGVRVVEARDDWRHVRIRLPLNFFTRNMGGSMFGGTQSSVADPIPALACARVFPGYSVWTRTLKLEFDHPGLSDLELRFDFSSTQEADIRRDLARRGRSTPTFELAYFDGSGRLCTRIHNTVAIRPRGYRRQPSAEGEN